MNTYTQITYEQRCQIYALKDTGCSQQSMADTIGVSQSAISRELKRNTGNRGYRYKQAQSKADQRRGGDWYQYLRRQGWQRGLNENTNGLLRQYWPKCTDFKKVSGKEVSSVIVQLNDRPRKKLGYNTPLN